MITESAFTPAWWLRGPHGQTLWPLFFGRRDIPNYRTERLELPDGDFVDLAWSGEHHKSPLVLVLHGLEGSLHSHYAQRTINALNTAGYPTLFMHFRGCSGEPNRMQRSYHSGDTGDLATVMEHARRIMGKPVGAAVGFSLGGNVLLKWLGEQGREAGVETAVAVSVPFNLNDCALRLEQGLSKLYRNHLLKRLRRSYKRRFGHTSSPLDVDVSRLKTFRQFDHQVTAPLNGFTSVDHYYGESSSRQYLTGIRVPTLILHAMDDPFMWPSTVPGENELSPEVTLELSPKGGHVGFVAGTLPWRPWYWLEQRIPDHFNRIFGIGGA
jgi:predicted alpha/beta-fold hydrolase